MAVERALDAINEVLEEPIESLIAIDKNGAPASRRKAPQDIDEAARDAGRAHLPRRPRLAVGAEPRRGSTPPPSGGASRPTLPNVLLCGSGARRGGAVSGLGGHNAAQAVLDARRDR